MSSERWPVPPLWRWKALGEVGHVAGGGTPSTRDPSNFAADGTAWITPADLSGYNGTYIKRGRRSLSKKGLLSSGAHVLPTDSVLFSSRAPIGYCVLAANELATSQGFKSLILNPALSSTYVRHYLLGSTSYAESQASGTTFKELSSAKFAALRIPLAPHNEQIRIADRLDALAQVSDEAIANINAARRTSNRFRIAILKAAFSGELTEEWRRHNIVEASETHIARVPEPEQPAGGRGATDRIVEGGVGLRVNGSSPPLPYGWSWQPLLRLARQETGHTPSRGIAEYWNGEIPWVGVRDAGAHHGETITTTMQTISAAGLENSSARLLPKGAVLLCRTAGSIGHVCCLGKPMATSQDFVAWICGPALDPTYLMYLLVGERDMLRRLGQGTAHPTIYLPEIRAFSIAVAPLAEQLEIVRRLNTLFSKLKYANTKIKSAAALTDNYKARLHERAFCGELEPPGEGLDPIDVTLAQCRSEFEMKKPQRRIRPNPDPSKGTTSPASRLAARYDVWPGSGYTFEELRDGLKGTYEEAREAIFSALRGEELKQQFDERRRVMVFVRKQP